MLDLKAPSKSDRKKLRLTPISRKDISRTNGAGEGSKSDRRTHERKRIMGGGSGERKNKGAGKEARSGASAGKKTRDIALDE